MPGELDSLGRHYATALEAYLKEPGEDALRAADELGQHALAQSLGILDALTLHALALESPQLSGAAAGSASNANAFLRRVLTPFDLELRSAQARQAELRGQVETVSKELESFRYSVSHDLRAPLRAIDGFSGILAEEHAKELDEDGRHCLEIVRSSAQRLGQLIEDLLLLVRVGRSPLSRQSLHISDMAREVADQLQRKEPGRGVALDLQPGLVVEADAHLVQIVLENLLGNAWKFTAKTPQPRVEFGATERPEGRVFFVRDNGVGFDMEYVGKLFTPFQRLHSENEFPGTGIGLAVVRRIVDRHGGRVWIEAAVDRGATVYFTLQPAPTPSVGIP